MLPGIKIDACSMPAGCCDSDNQGETEPGQASGCFAASGSSAMQTSTIVRVLGVDWVAQLSNTAAPDGLGGPFHCPWSMFRPWVEATAKQTTGAQTQRPTAGPTVKTSAHSPRRSFGSVDVHVAHNLQP